MRISAIPEPHEPVKSQLADREYAREKIIDRLAECHHSAKSRWERRLADVESQIKRLKAVKSR